MTADQSIDLEGLERLEAGDIEWLLARLRPMKLRLSDRFPAYKNEANAKYNARIARLLAALSLPSPIEGWKPIETAPKDGTEVLLWVRNGGHTIGWWESGREFRDSPHFNDWISGYECNEAGFTRVYNPTHWRPLPAAPSRPEDHSPLRPDGRPPSQEPADREPAGGEE